MKNIPFSARVSRETTRLIEARKIAWSPASRGEVTLDGIRLPVSSIDVEDTLRLQQEYVVRGFVKARESKGSFWI